MHLLICPSDLSLFLSKLFMFIRMIFSSLAFRFCHESPAFFVIWAILDQIRSALNWPLFAFFTGWRNRASKGNWRFHDILSPSRTFHCLDTAILLAIFPTDSRKTLRIAKNYISEYQIDDFRLPWAPNKALTNFAYVQIKEDFVKIAPYLFGVWGSVNSGEAAYRRASGIGHLV